MTAIALLQINPLALPSLPLEWRKALPECPGVYFAIDDQGPMMGMTIIRQQRMKRH